MVLCRSSSFLRRSLSCSSLAVKSARSPSSCAKEFSSDLCCRTNDSSWLRSAAVFFCASALSPSYSSFLPWSICKSVFLLPLLASFAVLSSSPSASSSVAMSSAMPSMRSERSCWSRAILEAAFSSSTIFFCRLFTSATSLICGGSILSSSALTLPTSFSEAVKAWLSFACAFLEVLRLASAFTSRACVSPLASSNSSMDSWCPLISLWMWKSWNKKY
mmetsp:Transcript_24786/g.45276  ORF Transcript_24786/g.45276 Transcript_24786/m.45276 type:complete len:218 (-) Transcript_24786:720-1373(-)